MVNVTARLIGSTKLLIASLLAAFILFVGIALVPSLERADAATPSKYLAEISVKNYGTIVVELDRSAAPKTVDNFVKLADKGFYDGLIFHRIVKGFCVQGGGQTKDGTTRKADTIIGEFKENGWKNPISHKRGTISMARGDDPNSASSEFFIVPQDYQVDNDGKPYKDKNGKIITNANTLDGKYAAFGHVVAGMEVVDQIESDASADFMYVLTGKLSNPAVIETIKITPCLPASGWKSSNGKWWYKYDSATKKKLGKEYPANTWAAIDGKWYHFDKAGWMQTGWLKSGKSWYYFGPGGDMQWGWVNYNNNWYLMGSTGKMLTGWQSVDGKKYFLKSSGVMKTGWYKERVKEKDKTTGKEVTKDNWYFFNRTTGAMASGTMFIDTDNKVYLCGWDGVMVTGLQDVNGESYYFQKSGAMKMGWQKIKSKWYYFSPNDLYKKDKKGKVIKDKNGNPEIEKYFGYMVKNAWVDNYWVDKNGVMATNAWVDNDKYYVGKDGKWVPNAKKTSK